MPKGTAATPPAAPPAFYRTRPHGRRIRHDRVKSALARDDGDKRMLPKMQFRRDHAPMTNAERQAEFRKRNPGYYQRLHAQRRAAVQALAAQRKAAAQVILTIPVPTVRLALPAPAVIPVLPGINTTEAMLAPAPAPLPIAQPARRFADRSLAA